MVESKELNIEREVSIKHAIPLKFDYKKEKVAIVKLDDYEPENIKRALKSILELLDLKDYFNGKTVLLKPNVLTSSEHTFTPCELVTGLIQIFKNEAGVKEIFVGDSTFTKNLTSHYLKKSKIKEKCEAEGAQVINFFESERKKIDIINPPYSAEESIYLPKEICDIDLVVNMPKLKTHTGYVYTGAIKNLFGILGNKQKMHIIHQNKDAFQRMLGDIYFAIEETNKTDKPKVLTIMDAVVAMEGKGPQFGKPRKIGLLIAGFNSAAIDIVGYTLMNGDPNDLKAITSVANRTKLPIDISQLEIVGEKKYSDYIIDDFKKPKIKLLKGTGYAMKWMPIRFVKFFLKMSIKINKKKCTLCLQCVNHCPASAMAKKKDKIIIDRNKCIECFCCGESCPNDAISAKWYIFRIAPYLILLFSLIALTIIWVVFFF